MAGAQARLRKSGLSLWLTDWKDSNEPWPGRSLHALVDGRIAAWLGFSIHPDGQAVSVENLKTHYGYQGRGFASVLMDALYAAHPTAWIDHGGRTSDGCRWWNKYTDPAPHRNIHNRPPQEWARYFDATVVGLQKARNAELNRALGLDGHRAAVYRYREHTEAEDERWILVFQEAEVSGLDPTAQDLYGGMRLFLRPGLQRMLLDTSVDVHERAHRLLDHVGHGNLPHSTPGWWNASAHTAFEDTAMEEARGDAPRPSLHVVFQILPLPQCAVPEHDARPRFVAFTGLSDIPVQVAGISWRPSDRPWALHSAEFTPAVSAAIEPLFPRSASPAYRARYDQTGHLRQEAEPTPAGRQIADFADRILRDSSARASSAPNGSSARSQAQLPFRQPSSNRPGNDLAPG